MFGELERDPGLGRSETMRRSMLAMMKDNDKPYFAHPMFWALFVVVGEGASSGATGTMPLAGVEPPAADGETF